MIDPLHHRPWRARRTPRYGPRIRRTRIERLDRETVIGARDQPLLERRALEHAIDQLEPLLARGRRKFTRKCKLFGVGHREGSRQADRRMQRERQSAYQIAGASFSTAVLSMAEAAAAMR